MAAETQVEVRPEDVVLPKEEKPKEDKPRAQKVAHHKDTEPKELREQQAALDFPLKSIVLRKENVRTGELPDMTELVNSVKAEGIIEPLIAAPALDEEGNIIPEKYELIAGNRRYWAAKELGLKSVPVRLVSADEARRHRLAIIENLQRVDMNPMDKALGIHKLMENEGLDQKDAAKALGFSPGFVSQHLALLKLPKKVQDSVKHGKLDLTHARQIGRLSDEETMVELAKEAQSLSHSELQLKVDRLIEKAEAKEAAANKKKKASRGSEDEDEGEERASKKMTRAEFYEEVDIQPAKKDELRQFLVEYGSKLDRAESEEKQREYRFILKGLALAAGVKAK